MSLLQWYLLGGGQGLRFGQDQGGTFGKNIKEKGKLFSNLEKNTIFILINWNVIISM